MKYSWEGSYPQCREDNNIKFARCYFISTVEKTDLNVIVSWSIQSPLLFKLLCLTLTSNL